MRSVAPERSAPHRGGRPVLAGTGVEAVGLDLVAGEAPAADELALLEG